MADFFLSPTGRVVGFDPPGVSARPGGGNQGTLAVRQSLPGVAFELRKACYVPVTAAQIPGARGYMDVRCLTGVAGASPQALVFLCLSATVYLGLAHDTSNRPYLVLTDAAGTVIARTAPTGPARATGLPLHIQMAWDATAGIDGTRHAYMVVNDVPGLDRTWTTDPQADWTSFSPTELQAGATTVSGYDPFVGTLRLVTVTTLVPTLSISPYLVEVDISFGTSRADGVATVGTPPLQAVYAFTPTGAAGAATVSTPALSNPVP